jgi:hypothetical protein
MACILSLQMALEASVFIARRLKTMFSMLSARF